MFTLVWLHSFAPNIQKETPSQTGAFESKKSLPPFGNPKGAGAKI
jgi:hypothetical protein